MTTESTHQEKVRERFTETAEVFARTTRRTRTEEAERLAEYATAGLVSARSLVAIDLACGLAHTHGRWPRGSAGLSVPT